MPLTAILVAVAAVGLLLVLMFGPRLVDRRLNSVWRAPPYFAGPEAVRVHNRLFLVDFHCDFLLWQRKLLKRHRRGHVDLIRLLEGNVAIQTFSVVTKSPWGQGYEGTRDTLDSVTTLVLAQRWPPKTWWSRCERALHQARRLREAAARSKGRLVVVQDQRDLTRFCEERAQEPRRVAGLLAIEGLHALDGRFENLDVLHRAGFRIMAPVHMFDNDVAGSAQGVEKYGLTDFGRRVMERLEALEVIVDLAHASDRTIDEVVERSSRPVLVSHTGVRGTCDSPRNLSDDQVRKIAGIGGLIGVGLWDGAVCGRAPSDVAAAALHTIDLVGARHVALGSDFDGTVTTTVDASGWVCITEALLQAGLTEDEASSVMGGNALRLLQELLPEAESRKAL